MLSELIQKAIELGAEVVEIDYKDGHERITAISGHLGVGLGSVPSGSTDSEKLFDEIEALRKKKRVKVGQVQYRASVEDTESFGEWAHRIRLTKVAETEPKPQPRLPKAPRPPRRKARRPRD